MLSGMTGAVGGQIMDTVMQNKDDLLAAAASKLGLSPEQSKMARGVFDMFDTGNGQIKKGNVANITVMQTSESF